MSPSVLFSIPAPVSGLGFGLDSVLGHFGVVHNPDVLAQANGQDHSQQLNEGDSKADAQNHPHVCPEPGLHTLRAAHFVDDLGPVRGADLAEAGVRGAVWGDGGVLTGAGEQQLRTVDDDHVTLPVITPFPATALHVPLDEVPGLLCCGVVSRIILQDFTDDLWHLLIQHIFLEVNESSSCDLSDEDQQETGEVQAEEAADFVDGAQTSHETHEHGEAAHSDQDVTRHFHRHGVIEDHDETLIVQQEPQSEAQDDSSQQKEDEVEEEQEVLGDSEAAVPHRSDRVVPLKFPKQVQPAGFRVALDSVLGSRILV